MELVIHIPVNPHDSPTIRPCDILYNSHTYIEEHANQYIDWVNLRQEASEASKRKSRSLLTRRMPVHGGSENHPIQSGFNGEITARSGKTSEIASSTEYCRALQLEVQGENLVIV